MSKKSAKKSVKATDFDSIEPRITSSGSESASTDSSAVNILASDIESQKVSINAGEKESKHGWGWYLKNVIKGGVALFGAAAAVGGVLQVAKTFKHKGQKPGSELSVLGDDYKNAVNTSGINATNTVTNSSNNYLDKVRNELGDLISNAENNADKINETIGYVEADNNAIIKPRRSAGIKELITQDMFPAAINLADLNGANGFKINGESTNAYSANGIGDINNDGFDDVAIGAPAAGTGGRVYVVFGKNSTWSTLINPADLNGTNGFIVEGEGGNVGFGMDVRSVGDINGDGIDDFAIGATEYNSLAGRSYVVFGKNGTWSSSISASSLNGANGFVINGEATGDRSGKLAGIGDINGDGIADLAIGAYNAAPSGKSGAGRSYIVFGKNTGWSSALNLADLNGSNGIKIDGENAGDWSGGRIGAAGDVNGDGIADLLIGADGADPSSKTGAGRAYVVFGKTSGWSNINLADLNGANGFKIDGELAGDALSPGGYGGRPCDVNGDGISDVLLGAEYADPFGNDHAGRSYVIFGKKSGWSGTIDITGLDGTSGFKMSGEGANDCSGFSISGVGDFNGDGIDDLIVGTESACVSASQVGTSYVIFGKKTGWSNFNLADLNGTNGIKINGEAIGDSSGLAVDGAGDVNGDGIADVIIGAPGMNSGNGRYYVVFGRDTYAPDINANHIDIYPGRTLTLNRAHLNVTGEKNMSRLEITTSNVTHGFFDRSSLPGTTISNFTMQEIDDGTIRFTHDNSTTMPGYSISASDGVHTTEASAATVMFHTKDKFPSTLSLMDLDGKYGFKIFGEFAGDRTGCSVGNVGDVNNDGIDDLGVGACDNAVGGAGRSYVIFGKTSVWPEIFNLSDLNGTNGFKLDGETAADHSGYSISGACDVNGDGIDDLAIGAIYASPLSKNAAGRSYVVFGKASEWSSIFQLSNLDGTSGFKLNGENAGDFSGRVVSCILDINGDGFDDLLIGAPGANSFTGKSYVVFGKATGWSSTFDLSTFNGINGFRLDGEAAGDYSGTSVSGIGDINGDGINDFVIGAIYAHPDGKSDAGKTYVVFGKASGWSSVIQLSSLDGTNGFKLNGENAGDYSGNTVSGVGDINGDGIEDLVIGSYYTGPTSAARSYVVFGKSSGWASAINLADLNGTNGFKLDGEPYEGWGHSVSGAGDVNGDGIDDLLIGAHGADPYGITGAGRSYVVFGKKSGWTSTFDLSTLNGTNGFKITGEAFQDYSGEHVSKAGDINGDGIADIVIGAGYADIPGKVDAGKAYVIFGRDTHPADLNANQINIYQGQTLTLGERHINATDPVQNASQLTITASNMTHGYFDRASLPGTQITSFTMQEIKDGAIRFVHDNSTTAPGYSVSVNDKTNDTPAAASTVLFNTKSKFASAIDLSNLDGVYGFVVNGEAPGDKSGHSVGGADINGDGFSDLIVGADFAAPSGKTCAGRSYVVFGKATNQGILNLSSLNGSNGFVMDGEAVYDYSGWPVRGIGDLNGDGIDDIAIGAHNATNSNSQRSGKVYVVFGKNSTWDASMQLTNLNGANGFKIEGEVADDYCGRGLNRAGDVNGDGISDLLIGAYGADPSGKSSAGRSYVVFGKNTSWTSPFKLADVNGNNGFRLEGEAAGDVSGISVGGGRDVNGDGISDFIIGTEYGDPAGKTNAGRSYVVFGKNGTWTSAVNLADLSGSTGFKIDGETAGDESGNPVNSIGDINGDGIGDIGIGSMYASPSGKTYAGIAYVVFGKNTGWTSPISLTSLDGTNGCRFNGEAAYDGAGWMINGVGDINGDGIDDFIVGSSQHDPSGKTNAGRAYVIFGKRTGWVGTFNLTGLTETDGVIINGETAGDGLGSVGTGSGIGDFNGDGISDLAITAYNYASSVGRTYVLFGRDTISPTLNTKQLTIGQGQALVLGSAHLNATDPVQNASQLTFTVSNVTEGFFDRKSAYGTEIQSFTMQEIKDGDIRFVHNNSTTAPSFNVSVNDKTNDTPVVAATITFDKTPILTANVLQVYQGQLLVLSPTNLNATDDNKLAPNLTFTVSDIVGGYFDRASASGTAIYNFTLEEIQNGAIRFKHNGTTTIPDYLVAVSDGTTSTVPVHPTTATLNKTPTLTANTLNIGQGQTLVLNTTNLNASDSEQAASNLTFTVSEVSRGIFDRVLAQGTSIDNFTLAEIQNNGIRFVHDNSTTQPSYKVSVGDGSTSSTPAALANVTFNKTPVLTTKALSIGQGQTVVLDTSNLNATDTEQTAANLTFTVTATQGRFERISAKGTSITTFTLQEIQDHAIQFVHLGSGTAPQISVSVSDGTTSSPAENAAITFSKAPVVNTSLQTQNNCCNAGIGEQYTFAFAPNTFTDPESDLITYNATKADGSALPSWLNFDAGARTFSGTPDNISYVGNVNIRVSATDSSNATTSDTFTIAVSKTLSATNTATPISYTEGVDYNLTDIVVTTPSTNVTAKLTLSVLDAGSLSTSTISGITSSYNVTTGVWEATGPRATVNSLLAATKYQPAENYNGAFSIAVDINDDYNQTLNSTINVTGTPVNKPPVLTVNSLTVGQGQTVLLSTSNLNATDSDNNASQLTFTISDITHGYFERMSAAGTPITTFTLSEVQAGGIRFVQNGDDVKPSYKVIVSDNAGGSTIEPESAVVTFSKKPVLNTNIADQDNCCRVGIGEQYNFTLAANTFIDPENDTMTYNATKYDGSLLPSWLSFNASTRTFSGTPISATQIGDLNIKVTAKDPTNASISDTFNLTVTKSLAATNTNAPIAYTEGTEYNLSDIDITTPSANVTAKLTLSNAAAGTLTTGTSGDVTSTYNATTGVWTASGAKDDVNALLAGLKYQPAADYHDAFNIEVKITDDYSQSISSTISATGSPELHPPKLEAVTFSLRAKKQAVITTSMLRASDAKDDLATLEFIIGDNIQNGYFIDLDNPGVPTKKFTQERVILEKIAFVSSNNNEPTFTVAVTDGVSTSDISNAIIASFTHENTNNNGASNALADAEKLKETITGWTLSGAGALITGVCGFFGTKRTLDYLHKKGREKYPFADYLRESLPLDKVDDFSSVDGRAFLDLVYGSGSGDDLGASKEGAVSSTSAPTGSSLLGRLRAIGLHNDGQTVTEQKDLARIVADAIRDKVSDTMVRGLSGKSYVKATPQEIKDRLDMVIEEVERTMKLKQTLQTPLRRSSKSLEVKLEMSEVNKACDKSGVEDLRKGNDQKSSSNKQSSAAGGNELAIDRGMTPRSRSVSPGGKSIEGVKVEIVGQDSSRSASGNVKNDAGIIADTASNDINAQNVNASTNASTDTATKSLATTSSKQDENKSSNIVDNKSADTGCKSESDDKVIGTDYAGRHLFSRESVINITVEKTTERRSSKETQDNAMPNVISYGKL